MLLYPRKPKGKPSAPACLNRTCRLPAYWRCRECGRPVCGHHSKLKDGDAAYCGCRDKEAR